MSIDTKMMESIGVATKPKIAEKKNGEFSQADFLKMLTAEMKFQNPMEPQDPSKFVDQLSQMNAIQSTQKMQATFQQMTDAMGSGQALQASGLIGKSVMAPGGSGNLLPGGSLRGQVNLQESTPSMRAIITDGAGQTVRVMNLGSHSAGAANFVWDGQKSDGAQASPGIYHVKVDAMVNGEMTSQDVRLAKLVDSVSIDAKKGVALNLHNGDRVSLKDVSEIF